MEVFVDVIFEMLTILFMGIICFIIYVYGKIFLIKIGLIEGNRVDESEKSNTQD